MRKKIRMLKTLDLRQQGHKQREIAELLGISERTVRTYLKSVPAVRKRPQRCSLLDPYKPYIDRLLLEDPFYNCARLFSELRARGYPGQITILREYVAEARVLAISRSVQFNAPDN